MSEDAACQSQPRPSLIRNILANWAGYFVFVVSGFIMPRLITEQAGQETLGVWDFGWSLVTYTSLLSLGVVSAITRYVARYRAQQDWDALNGAINSCLSILLVSFILGLGAVCGLTAAVPWLLPTTESIDGATAQWMVFVLGLSVAIQLPLVAPNAVITGCERFDVRSVIRVSSGLAVMLAMIAVLVTGGGLVALAMTHLVGETAAGVASFVVAKRVCPQFRVSLGLATWNTAKEMLAFGGKSVLPYASRAGLYQTNGIILAYFLGPAALAVYARQRALVTHAMRFITQYARVFTPTSSALHARGEHEDLRRLFIRSTKYALYLALPIVLYLCLMGGPLVHLWMGAGYEQPLVLGILAVGHLISLVQRPAMSMLTGMHRHGTPAIAELVAAAISVPLGLVFIGVFEWGLLGAALAIVIPVSVCGGLFLMIWSCRILGLGVWPYLRQVVPGPAATVVPFVLCLAAARWVYPDSVYRPLMLGTGVGGLIMVPVYWRYALPPSLKTRMAGMLRRKRSRPAGAPS